VLLEGEKQFLLSIQASLLLLARYGHFNFLRKYICKSRCTTGINDNDGKFATGFNVTGEKFAACGIATSGKFAPGIN
jgi:hypothetical protein